MEPEHKSVTQYDSDLPALELDDAPSFVIPSFVIPSVEGEYHRLGCIMATTASPPNDSDIDESSSDSEGVQYPVTPRYLYSTCIGIGNRGHRVPPQSPSPSYSTSPQSPTPQSPLYSYSTSSQSTSTQSQSTSTQSQSASTQSASAPSPSPLYSQSGFGEISILHFDDSVSPSSKLDSPTLAPESDWKSNVPEWEFRPQLTHELKSSSLDFTTVNLVDL